LIPRFNIDYNFNDFCYSIKTILSRDNFRPCFDILTSIFGERDFFFTNYGRTSLYVILRALNLPKGAKIGVPLYSCTVVFDAIIKNGYIPYFIDIDLENYTLDPKDLKEKIDELSAVIVIHTFGRPADMDKIKKVARDVPIIEDCAHSLLSEYKGKKTGTIGEVSFFSLSKYISARGGGMIISNDSTIEKRIREKVSLLKYPSKFEEIRHAITIFVHSILYQKPFYGIVTFPLGSYIRNKLKFTQKHSFKISRICNYNLGIFLEKLKNFKEKVKKQRENSLFLLEQLNDTDLVLPFEMKGTWCNYYLFPVLFENKEKRDRASKFLFKKGIDTAKLYHLTPVLARKFYGYSNTCPNTEAFVEKILVVPNHYTLRYEDLVKISNAIKEVS